MFPVRSPVLFLCKFRCRVLWCLGAVSVLFSVLSRCCAGAVFCAVSVLFSVMCDVLFRCCLGATRQAGRQAGRQADRPTSNLWGCIHKGLGVDVSPMWC